MNLRFDDAAHWHFTNDGDVPVLVQLEPWGDQVTVPRGSTLNVEVTECLGEPLEVRRVGQKITVWATRSGCQLVAFLDGKKI